MITLRQTSVNHIPIIEAMPKGQEDAPLPTLLFWHGWTSYKERNLHYAYFLAEKGYRIVLPEATGHGERHAELTETERRFGFWEVVLQSIHESDVIKKDWLDRHHLVQDSRIALAGTSMGAIITLGALTQYSWISAAISLMGTPYYMSFTDALLEQYKILLGELPYTDEQIDQLKQQLLGYDLSRNFDPSQSIPMFFWHGQKDDKVPFSGAQTFYEKVKYEAPEASIEFVVDEQAGHEVTRAGVGAAVGWLEKHL
ncbi:alpha/beta fold hydrolase [Tuberibacillus sp. Marseille-P3662]|uniref:alpha/beta fold hydrolase n=1 Tax=Tuberibacillus sp. Marseille-P3662 TaxID=1965358 RepID=UPI000A1CBE82|nr:alpha/beta fold hydrolase [Tuberibacillus sp. Marseille-P3662]